MSILMIDLANQLFLKEEKNAVNKFTTSLLKEYRCCKGVVKENFNRSLAMTVADERSFKSSNKCRICEELFSKGDNKVRDHDHVTGRYRGSPHKDCNINLRFIKKIPVIFQSLRDCDSHLIIQEISKSDMKINAKYQRIRKISSMVFTVNRNLILLMACDL